MRLIGFGKLSKIVVGGVAAVLVATTPVAAAPGDTAPGDTAPGDNSSGGLDGASMAQVSAPVPELNWGPCGQGLEAFRCTNVEVPTDYDRPHGPTTTLALTKLPATKPKRKIGTLFTNPGGPGGSGVQFVQQAAQQAYTPAIRERFDILGFDPRAVAGSDPATCYRTAEEEEQALRDIPAFPYTATEEWDFIGSYARIGRHCTMTSQDRFSHASTANVARDMDLLRQALGDEKLSYVGYSYGTYLGATYSRLFPDRVRALVLDGAMEPAAYSGSNGDARSVGARIGQGGGASETYGEFLRLCADAGPDRCALASLGDPGTVMEETFERLKKDPVTIELPNGTPFDVTYTAAVQMTFQGMYEPAGWADLAATLADFSPRTQGDGTSTSTAEQFQEFEQLTRPRRGKDYASVGGALASMCVDTTSPLEPRDFSGLADAEDATAPHFGRARAWVGSQCEFLDVEDEDAFDGPWEQDVDTPVMVLGTRFDPATPYSATRPYADHYPNAHLLTLEGWGHTTLGKSQCADRAVSDYLVNLDAPADGSSCEPDAVPFPAQQTMRELDRPQSPPGVPGNPLTQAK